MYIELNYQHERDMQRTVQSEGRTASYFPWSWNDFIASSYQKLSF